MAMAVVAQVDPWGQVPSLGQAIKGAVNLGAIPVVHELWSSTGIGGGLLRANLSLHEGDAVDRVGPQLQTGALAGEHTLLTVFGTPFSLATKFGPADASPLPVYARSVPSSSTAYADYLVQTLAALQSRYGVLPDYLEIGNEPDRWEYWSGNFDDYALLYQDASRAVQAWFPSIRIGGPGLASATSALDGRGNAMFALIDEASARNLPLHFLSWHHYGPSAEMRHSGVTSTLRNRVRSRGLADLELFVTEWNLRPSADLRGSEFDGSRAAAHLTGFLATAADEGLDGSCFFMLHDDADEGGIGDLTGQGMGAVTARGIRKPIFRLMEFLYGMAEEIRLPVVLPEDELAVSVLATRSGSRIQIVIANDPVEADWVFRQACQEIGVHPGVALSAAQAAGASRTQLPRLEGLIAAGLTPEQAEGVLNAGKRALKALETNSQSRQVRLELPLPAHSLVSSVWKFDDSHNAPAAHRMDLLPHLEKVEEMAQKAAHQAGLDTLSAMGLTGPAQAPGWTDDDDILAAALGVPASAATAYRASAMKKLAETRLQDSAFLNTLPGAALTKESGAEAGVSWLNGSLILEMAPGAVTVLELQS